MAIRLISFEILQLRAMGLRYQIGLFSRLVAANAAPFVEEIDRVVTGFLHERADRRGGRRLSEVIGMMVAVGSRSIRFAETARALGDEARRAGLVVPSFRSPPRVLGRDRTIRRRADGSVAVAVALGGRPFVAVVADMIEGTIAANRLQADDAERVRRELWVGLQERGEVAGESVSDAA